jgi:hypothetical protein
VQSLHLSEGLSSFQHSAQESVDGLSSVFSAVGLALDRQLRIQDQSASDSKHQVYSYFMIYVCVYSHMNRTSSLPFLHLL